MTSGVRFVAATILLSAFLSVGLDAADVLPPTVATPAAGSPSPATGTTCALSVLGADDGGEAGLTYTWATTGTPPAVVAFSANGSNAAKATSALFTKAGAYAFTVTIRDATSASVTSSVNITVNQTLTTVVVTPASRRVNQGTAQTYTATGRDQFAALMSPQPTYTWGTTGGVGTITSGGVFTAGAGASGPFTVTATSGSKSGNTTGVVNAPPTVAGAAKAAGSPVTATNVALSVLGADDAGEAGLAYTWATTGTPPAAVQFLPNGSNAAKASTAVFSKAGSYDLRCTIADADGLSVTSATVAVVVTATVTDLALSPAVAAVTTSGTQAFTLSATDQFGQAITAPSATWAVSGGGSINASGLFTANATAGGVMTVTAAAGARSASATVYRTGGMTRQWWTGISGSALSALTGHANYPNSPTGTAVITIAEAPTSFGDNYGTRLQGYVVPPTTGSYTFWIASDDNSELWLSTGESPANRVKIASVTGYTNSRQWTKYPSQQSAAIPLEAGKRYYLEAIHKDATGGDNLAVGWTLPSAVAEQPIPGSRLQPFQTTANAAPTVAVAATAVIHPDDPASALLSVLGNDDAGEPSLTYAWAVVGTPPAPVVIGRSGSNAARKSTVRFATAGTYTFQATITDAQGLTVTSTATALTVTATLATIAVTPSPISVAASAQRTFAAQALDQFAKPLASPPTMAWTASGGGTIVSGTGVFTAGATAGGPHTVTATGGGRSGTASVTIGTAAPVALVQSLKVAKNVPLAFELTATDANRDTLTWTILTAPTHGTLSGTAPSLTYTPATNYVGSDSLVFRAADASGNSSATITITVVESPQVVAASVSPLMRAAAFDASRWANDAGYRSVYLAASVPSRIWETADPGPGVPVLTAISPRIIRDGTILPNALEVRTAPLAPVTFTVLGEGGLGSALLSSLTVQADANGNASTTFSLLRNGTGQIRAASPLASNFVVFSVTTVIAP